ncbi:MAG: hypothetical protein ACI3W5_15260 [Faecousia sp.]
MEKCYDIYLGSEAVGKATLTKEGLYWKIRCQCSLPSGEAHRVTAKAGEEIDLGILVPENGEYCLTKRIAMKRFADAQPQFFIKTHSPDPEETVHPIIPEETVHPIIPEETVHPIIPEESTQPDISEERFIAIIPEEPFAYIEELKDARLEEKDGEIGITLPEEEKEPEIQDSDPNQEYPNESAPE